MRAKEFIPASKPRNFVAKNQQTAGAGAHRDKKKAEKQGYEKHKGKDVAEDKAGWSDNSGTVKKYEPTKKGPMPSWRLNPDGTATDKNTGITYNRDGSVVKKEEGVGEGMFGIDSKTKGAIQNVVSQLSDIPGMWDHSAQTFTDAGMEKLKSLLKDNPKYIKYAVNLTADDYDESIEMERVRDPEDWDEGNTEPGNNFAIYINGKKWKVFPGPAGAYADSPEERREFNRLKDMAARKSAATGKKWEVYITGEKPTA